MQAGAPRTTMRNAAARDMYRIAPSLEEIRQSLARFHRSSMARGAAVDVCRTAQAAWNSRRRLVSDSEHVRNGTCSERQEFFFQILWLRRSAFGLATRGLLLVPETSSPIWVSQIPISPWQRRSSRAAFSTLSSGVAGLDDVVFGTERSDQVRAPSRRSQVGRPRRTRPHPRPRPGRAAGRGRRACQSGRAGVRARSPCPRSPGLQLRSVDGATCTDRTTDR